MLKSKRWHGNPWSDEIMEVREGKSLDGFRAIEPKGETWGAPESMRVTVMAMRLTNCEEHPFAQGCLVEKLAHRG